MVASSPEILTRVKKVFLKNNVINNQTVVFVYLSYFSLEFDVC